MTTASTASTADHISELLKAEYVQGKPPQHTVLSGVAKPLIELLYNAFGGWHLAMVEFFERILLNASGGVNCELHYMVLTALQDGFLSVFLEHCREVGLEPTLDPAPKQAVSQQQADAGDAGSSNVEITNYADNEKMPDGAKRVLKKRNSVAKSFHASHRMRIRFVTSDGAIVDRDYETRAAIKAVAHSLCDKRFRGTLDRLIEIPTMIYRALVDSGSVCKEGQDGPKLRRAFVRSLLTEKARKDPWVAFQFHCPFVYEISLIDADVRRRNTQIETCKRLKVIHEKQAAEQAATRSEFAPSVASLPFDIERLTLAIYVYYRLLVTGLCGVSIQQIESSFALVMYDDIAG